MKRFVFTVAAVALVASAGSAQETPATTPPATATPVVIGSAGPVVEGVPVTTAPARRGLFGRLRGRGTPTTTMPATVAPVVTPGTTITPAPTTAPSAPVPMPMPMPMPGTKGTVTTPAAPTGIVLASGTEMSGVVMPAMAATTATTTTAKPARRGLFRSR